MDYIHQYIAAKNGVTVPIKETNPSKAANVKYLLCAIDKANELSAASTNTSYCSNALATTQVVDTIAVADASNRLFNCNAGGYYKAGGATACSDCGVGYYCPAGGNVRNACSYGIATCSGNNNDYETLPASWTGKLNTSLALADVNAMGIPATTISQWEKIKCNRTCGTNTVPPDRNNAASINNATACQSGTLTAGVYLFTISNTDSGIPTDYNAIMAVFDHDVSYRLLHDIKATNILYNIAIDTNHSTFTDYDFLLPSGSYGVFSKQSNVTDVASAVGVANPGLLCVWRLK